MDAAPKTPLELREYCAGWPPAVLIRVIEPGLRDAGVQDAAGLAALLADWLTATGTSPDDPPPLSAAVVDVIWTRLRAARH
jgi:hypothetical protein